MLSSLAIPLLVNTVVIWPLWVLFGASAGGLFTLSLILIGERYRGIRPAAGYPAQPDHTEKAELFRILDATKATGMELTESFAMNPPSSVCGLYFAHPDAHYFGVGRIEKDQVEDYARRKGWDLATAERWLGPLLNYDPRAKLMRETCHEVLGELGLQNDPLFKLAMELEKIALEDPYFVEKKLYPNVDFYSGIVQKAIGIPTEMFTCIFALARTVGWIAQWNEMLGDPDAKIGRPRQLFTGAARREYVPMSNRK